MNEKDFMDLFVVMGQSNAQGQSETYKEFSVPEYQAITYEYLTDQLVQVKHPFGENINTLGDPYELGYYQLEGAVGCETGLPYGSLSPHFASKYYEITNRPILIEPCCCGASQIKEWLPGHEQGRYELTVEKVNRSINAVNERLNKRIEGRYLIWLQGESDGIYRTGTANYKTRFLQLWNALKQDLGFEKCFIIRVAKFRPDKYNDKPIIEAQEQLATEYDDIEMVTRITGYLEYPTENPKNPGIQDYYTEGYPYIDHYTWEGYRLVGETAGERVGIYINTNSMPEPEPEPYEGEITSSSEKLIAEYKFDNTITENLLPTFNEGFTHSRLIDEINDTITYRKVITKGLPSEMYFTKSTALKEVLNVDITYTREPLGLFEECTNLTSVKFNNRATPNLESLQRVFNKCSNLTHIDFGGMTTKKLMSLAATFSDCSSLETLDIGHWDVSEISALSATFRRCSNLKNLDLSKWNINKLIYASGAFQNCSSLTNLNISHWKTQNTVDFTQMFTSCTGLEHLDLSGWKISSNADVRYMFWKCSNLISLDISNFQITNSAKIANIINSCGKLKHIGMLYCDKNICETFASYATVVSGLIRNVYVLDEKAENCISKNNIQFINYKNKEVEIKLPKQLSENDRLYWNEDEKKYFIDSNGVLTETNITKRFLFKIEDPNSVMYVKNTEILPVNLIIKVPIKGDK